MKPAISPANRLLAIDDLDRAIVDLSTCINAATYELLVLIREFDERAGWLKWGFDHCADWLHWRCDLSVGAAREKVRVAHALKTLPAVSGAFRDGELSYSKVRALVRVANRDNEETLVDFALKTTAARVEERCRELRCGAIDSVVEANRAYASRFLTIRRHAERGSVSILVELPLEAGELIDKALDKARDDNPAPEFAGEAWSARQADALVNMAKSYLRGDSESSTASSENYLVNIHVEQSALASGDGRSGLPIEIVSRLGCDADAVVIVEDESGEPLSVGRKTRIVPTAIKRALKARDRGCVFPGCHKTRFVDAHHVQHWSAGGETSLGNLLLLCSRHHRLVHEGGYGIDKDYRDRWMFKRPDGIAAPRCGHRKEDTHDEGSEFEINDLQRDSAESFLSRLEKLPDGRGSGSTTRNMIFSKYAVADRPRVLRGIVPRQERSQE
jgi:hypothetical protein